MGPVKSRNAYRVEDAENEESSGKEVNPAVRVVASCNEVRQWNGGGTHLDVKRVVEDILGIGAKRSLKVEAPVLQTTRDASITLLMRTQHESYLGHVDWGDLAGLLKLSTVNEDDATESVLLALLRTLRLLESDEELDTEGTRETLLTIGADALEDGGSGELALDGGDLSGGEELALSKVDKRSPWEAVPANLSAVEGDGLAFVRLGSEVGGKAGLRDSDGGSGHGETVSVAADDGVGVLLGDVALALLRTDDDIVSLFEAAG